MSNPANVVPDLDMPCIPASLDLIFLLYLQYKEICADMLKVGDVMPDFEVVDQDGNKVTAEDLKGRKTIIYFYPKDNTSGCTAEACSLRDNYDEILREGYDVFGVSKDSIASHMRFRDRYSLPFTLLSDPSTRMLQDFGAWGEKKMYGRTVMGTIRRTFIFDENSVLTEVIDKVDTKNHAAQILK